MYDDLASKGVLVVGGTSGIGLATAVRFGQAGARVVVAGRSQDAGTQAAQQIAAQGAEGAFVQVDVCDSDSVASMFSSAVDFLGRVDIAFNNAGWESTGQLLVDTDEADWTRMIETKLTGTWRCMKHELRAMLAAGGGTVVNMAGTWGLVGQANYASYCAAAHGIMGLTRSAAKEYAREGIRVNAVCPGAVDSPMLSRMVGGQREFIDQMASGLAMGRVAYPEDVAEAVLWLSSSASAYVNGHGLELDGGGA